jgi:hypothetical protein
MAEEVTPATTAHAGTRDSVGAAELNARGFDAITASAAT